jgi:hypothetical protein
MEYQLKDRTMGQERNPSGLPSNLKSTLQELEGTLNEWEKIVPDTKPEENSAYETNKDHLEKELQKKARDILYKLKTQIDDLS